MRTASVFFALAVLLAVPALADKVIMRDGKIYEGKIMGETSDAVLISNPPKDPTPRFLQTRDILTLVRESRKPEPPSDRTFLPTIGVLFDGNFFSGTTLPFDAAPGFQLNAGFRIHSAFELDASFHSEPALSAAVDVKDNNTVLRSYSRFGQYGGGFNGRYFPFFRRTHWRAEPYLLAGFEWTRLFPKAASDYFSGTSYLVGLGTTYELHKPWYWDARFTYRHTHYGHIQILGSGADLSHVWSDDYLLSTGVSYRFL